MDYKEVLATCLTTKKFYSFAGRAGPFEFWCFHLMSYLAWLGSWLFLPFLFFILLLLLLITPTIAVTVRRLHDQGKGGNLVYILLVPFVGHLILLYWCAAPTEAGPNIYGPEPETPTASRRPYHLSGGQLPPGALSTVSGLCIIKIVSCILGVVFATVSAIYVEKNTRNTRAEKQMEFAQEQLSRGVDLLLGRRGITKDYDQARSHLKSAVRKGSPLANLSLGIIYQNGMGVRPDLELAQAYFETAADQWSNEDQNHFDLTRKEVQNYFNVMRKKEADYE